MGDENFLQTSDLRPGKSAASLEADRIKPELRNHVLPLNMNMRWFLTIPSIEKEPVWADSQYRWHLEQMYTMFPDERELKEPTISHDAPDPTE